jgi:hypothetical protein
LRADTGFLISAATPCAITSNFGCGGPEENGLVKTREHSPPPEQGGLALKKEIHQQLGGVFEIYQATLLVTKDIVK